MRRRWRTNIDFCMILAAEKNKYRRTGAVCVYTGVVSGYMSGMPQFSSGIHSISLTFIHFKS